MVGGAYFWETEEISGTSKILDDKILGRNKILEEIKY
jgi:hypothetical protein